MPQILKEKLEVDISLGEGKQVPCIKNSLAASFMVEAHILAIYLCPFSPSLCHKHSAWGILPKIMRYQTQLTELSRR
jgi:hypothetical protein